MNSWLKISLLLCLISLVSGAQIAWHIYLKSPNPLAQRLLDLYLDAKEQGNSYRRHDVAMSFDVLFPSVVVAFAWGFSNARGARRAGLLDLMIVCLFFIILQYAYVIILPNRLWWFYRGELRIAQDALVEFIYVNLISFLGYALGIHFRQAAQRVVQRIGGRPT